MNIQFLIVIAIIAAAIVYALVNLSRKRKSFSPKAGCGSDCGCNGSTK